jgi:hypothetical protein
MNSKRILSVIVVLSLVVGCAWASTETSGTAGFIVIPDEEAAQIVGGDGRACNTQVQIEGWWWCDGTWMGSDPLPEWDCSGQFTYIYERWVCGDAPSGECYETWMTGQAWCACQWYPEYQNCSPNNDWSWTEVLACQ